MNWGKLEVLKVFCCKYQHQQIGQIFVKYNRSVFSPREVCKDRWCGRGGGGASVTSTRARGGAAQRLKCSFQQFRDRGTFCIRWDRSVRRKGVFLFSEKSKLSDITGLFLFLFLTIFSESVFGRKGHFLWVIQLLFYYYL